MREEKTTTLSTLPSNNNKFEKQRKDVHETEKTSHQEQESYKPCKMMDGDVS